MDVHELVNAQNDLPEVRFLHIGCSVERFKKIKLASLSLLICIWKRLRIMRK
jgi:hypothetical protein